MRGMAVVDFKGRLALLTLIAVGALVAASPVKAASS